ncbi:GNAT family N-acetyltransferase [Amorphus sp. MBR-141]
MDIRVDAWSDHLPLLTSRFVLAAIGKADIAAIAELGNDFEIAKNTSRVPFPLTTESVAGWLAGHGPNERALRICPREDDPCILGVVGLSFPLEGLGDLGCWIGRAHWGDGIATEAAHAVVDFGFETLGLDAIEASCRVTNPGSRRVIEKCGFQPCGHGLMHSIAVGGSVPIERYGLDRKTWYSLKTWAHA